MPRKRKYTDEQFIEAVKHSRSVRQVLTELNLNQTGGNYQAFYNRCKQLGLTVAHFKSQSWNKGLTFEKKPITEYLNNSRFITSHSLRLRLINSNIKQAKCERCGITEWNGLPAPLELDHMNGIHTDNRLENLQILCPNCHYQTVNHRGKNKGVRKRMLPT
jgi:hypothetical protein